MKTHRKAISMTTSANQKAVMAGSPSQATPTLRIRFLSSEDAKAFLSSHSLPNGVPADEPTVLFENGPRDHDALDVLTAFARLHLRHVDSVSSGDCP